MAAAVAIPSAGAVMVGAVTVAVVVGAVAARLLLLL